MELGRLQTRRADLSTLVTPAFGAGDAGACVRWLAWRPDHSVLLDVEPGRLQARRAHQLRSSRLDLLRRRQHVQHL